MRFMAMLGLLLGLAVATLGSFAVSAGMSCLHFSLS